MEQPRYALVAAEGARVVAFCADVTGLYAEPAAPPRVVYELRGCEPRGDLARAVAEAVVEGAAPFGALRVRTVDGELRSFDGVRVRGARGDVVTIEANGIPLFAGVGGDAVPCGNVVRVSPPEPEERTHTEVTFTGCSPRGALRDALAAGAEEFGPVRYQVLWRTGGVRHYGETVRVTGWGRSATHHSLVDISVAVPRAGLIPPGRRAVWDVFDGPGMPAEPGIWRRFTGAAREEWRNQAEGRSYDLPEPAPGATYEIDGRDVTDLDGFVCAVTEAVHGPGRAFPFSDPRALGAEFSGRTLVWRHADIARACLGVTPLLGPSRPATFQELVDGLRAGGTRVVLA